MSGDRKHRPEVPLACTLRVHAMCRYRPGPAAIRQDARMASERETLRSLLIAYSARYAVSLPEVQNQIEHRFPGMSPEDRHHLAVDLIDELVADGVIALFGFVNSGEPIEYGQRSNTRLRTDEAWLPGDDPGDHVAATTLGEAMAAVLPDELWLEWEYPAG